MEDFLGILDVFIEGDLLRIRNPWDSLPCITTICDDMFGIVSNHLTQI